jgi:hypothetical protein
MPYCVLAHPLGYRWGFDWAIASFGCSYRDVLVFHFQGFWDPVSKTSSQEWREWARPEYAELRVGAARIGTPRDYSPRFCISAPRFFAARISFMVSSMMVQAEKDGGIERGGNSLNVDANFTTSSIAP